MHRKKMRPRYLAVAGAVLLAAVVGGCALAMEVGDSEPLLRIDGYGVPEEEFRLFLNDERAMTAAHFAVTYGVTLGEGDWNTAYGGEIPMEVAKSSALAKVKRAKTEAILLHERGLLEDVSFEALTAEMDASNAERREKEAKGEAYYGLQQYDLFTYYQYARDTRWAKLMLSQQENGAPPPKEVLDRLYEANRELFYQGTELSFEARYADGESETVTATEYTIGKEDYETADLLAALEGLEPGETLEGVGYHGKTADIVLLSQKALGYLPVEECRSQLMQIYAEESLYGLVKQRAADAEVKINKARYAALQMGG